ncbi:MAG: GNAT family N-acetyltransferase [Pseudomonadota bacterium]
MDEPVCVLSPSDPKWDAWLKLAPHDFYHLADYHAFAHSAGEGQPEMVVCGKRDRFIAWPYLVRRVNARFFDATSVYGYTGPTGSGLDDDSFRMDAWQLIRNVWAERNLVTMFTRFHPLLGNAAICNGFRGAESAPGGEVLTLGRSVSIDLADDRETRRSKYRQVLRQEIKRAEAKGLVIELDLDWYDYDRFVELYAITMHRNDAKDRYLFQRDYFDGLRNALGKKVFLVVADFGGDVAAAMMFTVYNGIAEAHFTGVDPDFAKLSPLKGLIDGVADIARDLGAARLHLGAGRGGAEDSLFEFKSRYSKSRHGFAIGRWVLDAQANAELCGPSHRVPNPEFFPAYRATAAEMAEA